MLFEQINTIDCLNRDSWTNKIFLTIDTDWCSDEVLLYTLELLEKNDTKATIFVTNKTKYLDRMKQNPNLELGIHPNFNPLLNGDFTYGNNVQEVLSFYKNIIPNAVSMRSHSLTQNSLILSILKNFDLKFECNNLIPYESGMIIKPFKHWDKQLNRISHFWEDDVHYINSDEWNLKKYLDYNGLKVFSFHPIHIFLNTENIERYENARQFFNDFPKLNSLKNENTYGTKNFFLELLDINKDSNEN